MREFLKRNSGRIISVAIWLVIWQTVSMVTGLDLLLASPVSVCSSLFGMFTVKSTYSIIFNSFFNITAGYVCAFLAGSAGAVLAGKNSFVRSFLSPLLTLMKSLPMASFIILLLIWFGQERVALLTSFIVAFPLVYSGVLSGISKRDRQLIEMSEIYGVSVVRRICWIDIPQILPVAKPDFIMAAGMCLKAGVSAEVIGLATGTIGEQMYYSKLYIDTSGLFAWSIVAVCLSILWEKMFIKFIDAAEKRIERL